MGQSTAQFQNPLLKQSERSSICQVFFYGGINLPGLNSKFNTMVVFTVNYFLCLVKVTNFRD